MYIHTYYAYHFRIQSIHLNICSWKLTKMNLEQTATVATGTTTIRASVPKSVSFTDFFKRTATTWTRNTVSKELDRKEPSTLSLKACSVTMNGKYILCTYNSYYTHTIHTIHFSVRDRITPAQLRQLLAGQPTTYCPLCDERAYNTTDHNNSTRHQLMFAWLAVS